MNTFNIDTTTTTNTYIYLYKIAKINLDELKKNEEGGFYKMLIIVVFSCFTIEAYMNHLAKRLDLSWKKINRTLDKLEILFIKLELDFDEFKEPIQSIYEMFAIRNKLAHGNTESINNKTKQEAIHINEIKMEEALTSWEEKITKYNVEKYFENMKKIILLMNKKVDLNEKPFLIFSTTSLSANVVEK